MLFDSSLGKELGRSFSATLVVLVTIVMTVMLIRTLGQASAGRVNPSEVMLVMGYTVLSHLSTILTLSLFVAVTATLSRMYAASEMVVWFASGQGLHAFLKPLLRFAWPILLAVAVLALVVWPWSNRQIQDLRERYQARGDLERVAPGRFIESAGGQRVFFIDRESSGSESGTNIFIATTERGKETITSAQSGHIETRQGERFLVLEKGHRLETDIATGEMRVSEFDRYGLRIDAKVTGSLPRDAPTQKPTLALLRDPSPSHLAELSWRLGLALAAFNCVIIALATTRVNPRAGRSVSLLFSLFAFTSYYNLLNAGQGWIGAGRVGFGALMIVLHGAIFLLAVGWLLFRSGDWRTRWQRPSGEEPPA